MAEQVQLHLESRLPELKDLLKKALFSDDEIQTIVSKRTKYEYRLKRRGAILEDFLAYIEYEKQLEITRRDRVQAKAVKMRHSLSDHSIVQHIYGLYQRALVKFKGNTSLWTQFLEYAISQGGKQVLSRAFAKALQLHPLHAPFWRMAAVWEWTANGNMSAARAFLQRGLRTIPTDPDLWLGFFDLELDFAAKVKDRRSLLGIDSRASSVGAENEALQILNGAMAQLIFKHSLKEIPEMSPQLCESFLMVASKFEASLPSVKAALINEIIEAFPDRPKYLISIARSFWLPARSPGGLAKALEFIQGHYNSQTSAEMVRCYVDFLLDVSAEDDNPELLAQISAIYQEASSKKILDEDGYLDWYNLSRSRLNCGEAGLSNIVAAAVSCFPDSSKIAWAHFGDLIRACTSAEDLANIFAKMRRVADVSAKNELCELLADRIMAVDGAYKLAFEVLCLPAIKLSPAICRLVRAFSGPALRSNCQKILEKRSVNSTFYMAWIEAELKQHADPAYIRILYKKALILDPKDVCIWKAFILFEKNRGFFREAALVYADAMRNVENPDIFRMELSN